MSLGLRIPDFVRAFLALTWISFFVTMTLWSGSFSSLSSLTMTDACILLMGFSLPLLILMMVGNGGASVKNSEAKVETLISKLNDLEGRIVLPDDVAGKLKRVRREVEAEVSELKTVADAMGQQLDELKGKAEATKDMWETQSKLIEKNQQQAQSMAQDVEKAKDQAANIGNLLFTDMVKPLDQLEDRVHAGIHAMSGLVSNLDVQLADLAEGFGVAKQLSAETGEHIRFNAGELGSIVKHTNNELGRMKAAIANQIEHVDQMGALAIQRTEQLDHDFSLRLESVSATGQTMTQKAEQLQQSFEKQKSNLVNLAGLISDLQSADQVVADPIKAMISDAYQASAELEQKAQAAATGMQRTLELIGSQSMGFEGKLSDTAERITSMIDESHSALLDDFQHRISAIRQNSDDMALGLSSAMSDANRDMGYRLADFDERRSSLEAQLALMGERATHMLHGQFDEALGVLQDRMERVKQELVDLQQGYQAADLQTEAAMDQAAQGWFQRLQQSTDTALDVAEASLVAFEAEVLKSVERVSQTVETQIDLAADRSEQMAEQAATQIHDKVIGLYDKIDERAQASQAEFERAETNLQEQMGKASEHLRSLMETFAIDLGDASETAVSRLISMGRDVPQLAEQMSDSAQEALKLMRQAGEGYAKQGQQIRTMMAELEDMSSKIETRVDSLDAQVEKVGAGIDLKTDDVTKHIQQLDGMLNDFRSVGQALSEAIGERVSSLAQSTEITSTVVENVEQRLNDLAGVATENIEKAHKFASEVTSEAEDDLLKLDTLSRETYERWHQTRETMGLSLDEVSAQVQGLHGTLDTMAAIAGQQSAKLSAESEAAQERAQKLIDALNDGQKTSFLRTASDLVAKLQDVAIDVDTLLQGQLPAEVVRSIKSGDRSVSVRRLLGMKSDRNADAMLAHMYTTDSGFRGSMDTFMQGCERLLTLALESDPSRLMHTTVLTADVGKLYLFLRDALGGQDQAAA